MKSSVRKTKLLSIISIVMMLSMAFIGVSFIIDEKDSSALDSGDNAQYFGYSIVSLDTVGGPRPIIQQNAPITFRSSCFGTEDGANMDADFVTQPLGNTSYTYPRNSEYNTLYQYNTDDANLDFAIWVPSYIGYVYSNDTTGNTYTDGGIVYINDVEATTGNFPNATISGGSDSSWYGTYGKLTTISIPTSYFSSNTVTIKVVVKTQSMNPVVTLQFNVILLTHQITFNTDGGSSAPSTQTVRQGYTVSQPPSDPTKTNNTFGGWYKGSSLYNFSTPIASSFQLTAHWTPNTYTVSYDTQVSNYTIDPSTVNMGSSLTLPTAVQSGYNFKGWYDANNNKIGDAGTSYTPTTNITLTAHWEQVLSISSNPSTSVIKGNTWTYTPTVNTTGYTLSLSSNAPSWISVNGSSIQGTPGSSVEPGTYTFTMFCQKANSQTAEQSISLTVVSALTISNPTMYVIAYEG